MVNLSMKHSNMQPSLAPTGFSLRILQVGDIHLPEIESVLTELDLKDHAFPPTIVNSTRQQKLQIVMRRMIRLLNDKTFDIVAFVGDLTTRGDRAGLEACLSFLKSGIFRDWPAVDLERKAVMVPGNHDINREDCADDDLTAKFHPIQALLKKVGFPELPYQKPISRRAAFSDGRQQLVLGVNTCFGCGEKRYLPDIIQDELHALIERQLGDALKDPAKIDDIDKIFESLDVPAIHKDTINEISAASDILASHEALIVVGHHNLLPQVSPRFSPYTELVNSGIFRQSLLELKRPILYLHGHIHEDPIDMLIAPEEPRSSLTMVAAPRLDEGFNEVEVAYTRGGVPLGCIVRQYRFGKGQQMTTSKEVRISFRSGAEAFAYLMPLSRRIFELIYDKGSRFFGDLADDLSVSGGEIANSLNELLWCRLIHVDNFVDPPNTWRIRKAF